MADMTSGKHGFETFQRLFGTFLAAARSTGNPVLSEEAREAYRQVVEATPEEQERFCFENRRHLDEDKRVFIDFNNALVKSVFQDRKPQSTLLLLPFCLQHTSCPHRIVWEIGNCERCGQCPVGDVLGSSDPLHIPVRVAVRGIFAPRFIKELKPELTIAIACEDELFIGILRAHPFTCYGILGTQPEGYCINTELPFPELAEAFRVFLER